MPRFSRAIALRPVNSIKHVIDTATSAVTSVISTVPIIEAVDAPTKNGTTQVHRGSSVKALYLRIEVLATAGFTTVPRIYMTVQKNPGGNLAEVPPNAVGPNDDKKFVLHQEMIMVAGTTDVQIPRTMFQGVVRIPPRYNKFSERDELNVNFQHDAGETTGITNVCVQCIYKEFY